MDTIQPVEPAAHYCVESVVDCAMLPGSNSGRIFPPRGEAAQQGAAQGPRPARAVGRRGRWRHGGGQGPVDDHDAPGVKAHERLQNEM